MDKYRLRNFFLTLFYIKFIGMIAGLLYDDVLKDKKQKAVNSLSFSVIDNIKNAIDLVKDAHLDGKASEEKKSEVHFMINSTISSLRHAERLYEEADKDPSYLKNIIKNLVRLKQYIEENWGDEEKMISVMDDIDLGDKPDGSSISDHRLYVNDGPIDYSEQIELALEKGR